MDIDGVDWDGLEEGEMPSVEKKKEQNWSDDVTKNEKWHPPKGLFKESPERSLGR